MKKQLIISIACFVGALVLFIFMTNVSAVCQTIQPNSGLNKQLTLKEAEKIYLTIQKSDAKELKSLLAESHLFSIVSTSNPRTAMQLLNENSSNSSRTLASSAMIFIYKTQSGKKMFRRVYRIYVIPKYK